jgi:hypothetical protein
MTQTRKDALQELLTKVEAGELTSIAKGYHLAMGGKAYEWEGATKGALDADNAYRGSLDAAKALHNAVLPNKDSLLYISSTNSRAVAGVKFGTATNPARAWLIAILKALVSETEQ